MIALIYGLATAGFFVATLESEPEKPRTWLDVGALLVLSLLWPMNLGYILGLKMNKLDRVERDHDTND